MKKYLLTLFLILGIVANAYCSPDNSMSISPSAVDGTTVTASDENTRNNEISTKFNAHDHSDIDQTANTLAVGDAVAGNKTITANNADTNKPFLRYDDTANDWIVSTDGVNPSARLNEHGITFEGGTSDAYETTITVTDPTADRTITFPNASFTVGVGDMQYTDTRHYVGTFTRDTTIASGTQAITGVGFTPQFVFIMALQDTAVGEFSIGLDNGTINEGFFDNYNATANTWSNAGITIYDQHSGGNVYSGSITTLGADGFTITWTKIGSPTGTLSVIYVAYR